MKNNFDFYGIPYIQSDMINKMKDFINNRGKISYFKFNSTRFKES